MDNSERIEVPVVDPSGCPRPRRRGQRRDFLANCASGLAPSTATTNRGGAPEAGARAKKERAAKRMPTFRNPETLYQLQVAIRLRQHWKIKHQGRPALTARPMISVNRGLKAGQPLIDGLPATMLTTSVRDPRDTRACARAKRANCPVPASSLLAKATPRASSAAGPSTALKPEAAPGSPFSRLIMSRRVRFAPPCSPSIGCTRATPDRSLRRWRRPPGMPPDCLPEPVFMTTFSARPSARPGRRRDEPGAGSRP